ncbi:MAG: OmpA family protein [Proteobacteria bacterium]|jgi:outer membrane protein OmpA-like peptidoglycan-associated protein|nr:OmpA family protein [Pseudomonadota bacterium]MDA1237622.1 OmpA family protein [Pseudomonadota bacterium]
MKLISFFTILVLFGVTVAFAQLELLLPGVYHETHLEEQEFRTYQLPVGPFRNGKVKTVSVDGEVVKRAWRVISENDTTTTLMDSLRKQTEAAEFKSIFDCDTDQCGGFDFRFHGEIFLAPKMHIDLGNYKFLSAERKQGNEREYLSLVVSRGGNSLFLQLTFIGPPAQLNLKTKSSNKVAESVLEPKNTLMETVAELLEKYGSAVLSDVEFEVGSGELKGEDYLSLSDLSQYLKSNTKVNIALVGHTDSEGDTDRNMELSKERADSVSMVLISKFEVNPSQVNSYGIGPLSPRVSNLNATSRSMNRRVEVILLNSK